jgi:hypothetical protein
MRLSYIWLKWNKRVLISFFQNTLFLFARLFSNKNNKVKTTKPEQLWIKVLKGTINVSCYLFKLWYRWPMNIIYTKTDTFVIRIFFEGMNQFTDNFKLIVELLEKSQYEAVLHKAVVALGHYFEVLPDWVSTGPEQDEFENEIFEVFDVHNY